MAYLNVRKRRIEAKIAYVGAHLSGKETNLRSLQAMGAEGRVSGIEEVNGGALVSLDWTPVGPSPFQDCDVAVKVFAVHGALSPSRLQDLIVDTDGLVIVVDAAASAQDETKRTLRLVKEALANEPRPVVVQANKSDLEDALTPADLSRLLETTTWPVITASAAKGEGVVETLEAAVTHVIDRMREDTPRDEPATADHTPLLAALREILRETVTEHMARLEGEILARVENAAVTSVAEALVRLDRCERTTARVLDVCDRLDAKMGMVTAALGTIAENLERQALPTRSDFEALENRLRDDLASRTRAEREVVTASLTTLRRVVETTSVDPKKLDRLDVREPIVRIVDALGRLTETAATTAEATRVAGSLPSRLSALEALLQRELREAVGGRVSRVDEAVRSLNESTQEALKLTDARVAEIQTSVAELIEELKKRKKGWFT